jgi:hypothetical protein
MKAIASVPSKRSQFPLQPALPWVAILSLALFTLLAVLLGAGKLLNYVFPVGAVAVAVLLYMRAPLLYTGFTWWVWFLSPLVRRLADYRGAGFTNPSPILLAPYLVTFVALMTLCKGLPTATRNGGFPFVLSISGIIYGFLLSLIQKSTQDAVIGLLDWLTPVLFGFHLFMQWQQYPEYRKNLERVFVWAILVMGIYGVYQYLHPPAWDTFWLDNAPINSAGNVKTTGVRVWSTLNSGEPFAAFMSCGLLLLLISQSPLLIPASIAGYLSFLLSTVRSAWIAWAVGLLAILNSGKVKFQMRLLLIVLILGGLIIPLATTEPFSDVISDRFSTFSNLGSDRSVTIRRAAFEDLIDQALLTFIGNGIGGRGYDSALLGILLNYGWIGIFPYIGGIILLVFRLFKAREEKQDYFIGTARGIVLSCLVRLPVNGVLTEMSGMVLWGFIGMGIAATYYHRQKQYICEKY